MDNETSQPQAKSKKNKWLLIGRKILIGALITWCINFILLKTGWDSWETFSGKADQFAENIRDGSARLSPIGLWKMVTTEQNTYIKIDNPYDPSTPINFKTGKKNLWDKFVNWLGLYWYTNEGRPFWIGRIILLLAILVAVILVTEYYEKSDNKTWAAIVFPFNIVIKFFLVLLALALYALLFYLLIKLLLFIVGGIVAVFSVVATLGGLVKFIVDEAKEEAVHSSKKTIGTFLFPFLLKGKKVK